MATMETLDTTIWVTFITMGFSIAYSIYMLFLNRRQARTYDVLCEIQDILREKKQ